MCNTNCKSFFDPVNEKFEEIDCNFCKKNIANLIKKGDIHKIHFVCDKSHVPQQFMRIVYRYRNWYGDKDQFIYLSYTNPHYDFMKLCVNSDEIKQPVIYKAIGCYDGLSENGNPIWIILNNPTKGRELHPYNNQHECEIRGLPLCKGCNICQEIQRR